MTLTCVEKTAKEQRLEKEVKVNVRRVSGMLLSENAQRKMFFFFGENLPTMPKLATVIRRIPSTKNSK